MHPTLPTLLRIATVFSVGLEYFFNPEPRQVLEIVRKKDRMRFPDSPDAGEVAYYFESLDFPVSNRALNSYLAEFESVDAQDVRLHEHPGIEFLYVLSGQLELIVKRRESRTGGRRCHLLRLHGPARVPQARSQTDHGARSNCGRMSAFRLRWLFRACIAEHYR